MSGSSSQTSGVGPTGNGREAMAGPSSALSGLTFRRRPEQQAATVTRTGGGVEAQQQLSQSHQPPPQAFSQTWQRQLQGLPPPSTASSGHEAQGAWMAAAAVMAPCASRMSPGGPSFGAPAGGQRSPHCGVAPASYPQISTGQLGGLGGGPLMLQADHSARSGAQISPERGRYTVSSSPVRSNQVPAPAVQALPEWVHQICGASGMIGRNGRVASPRREVPCREPRNTMLRSISPQPPSMGPAAAAAAAEAAHLAAMRKS